MPDIKLGTKLTCFSCGTKFYDFGKPEPACPQCGDVQEIPKSGHKKEAKENDPDDLEVDGLDVDDVDDDVDDDAADELELDASPELEIDDLDDDLDDDA